MAPDRRTLPQLNVTIPANTDPLATLRHEFKYEYRHCDPGKVETILDVNTTPIYHASRESLVSSVYFDTPTFTSFHENLAGIARRFKLRLRWYDSPLPDKHTFFEVKRRLNRATAKDRYEIFSSQPLYKVGWGDIVGALLKYLPEKPRTLLRLRPEPIALVQYKRKHFRVRDPHLQIRLTLDRDIVTVNQLGAGHLVTAFPVPLNGRMILEVKSSPRQKRQIPQILLPLRPRVSRFSKYVVSCAYLEITGAADAAIITRT